MGVTVSPPRPLADGDDVSGFSCGLALVDEWVAKRAMGARSAGTAVVYAAFDGGRLAGFYSLSSQSVLRASTSGWLARNAPDQIPVILLGMMGVDSRYQGSGLGRDLLLDAVHRAQRVSSEIGARVLVVDPAGDAARSFYGRFGFRPVPGSGRMFAKLG